VQVLALQPVERAEAAQHVEFYRLFLLHLIARGGGKHRLPERPRILS
jgi:hypothetical protein